MKYLSAIFFIYNVFNFLQYGSSAKITCDFFQTIPINEEEALLSNGSYQHDGLIIPPELVDSYDYVYRDLTTRESVQPHLRACICQLKACLNLCCPWGMLYNSIAQACIKTTAEYEWPEERLLNISLANGQLQTVDINEEFIVRPFQPCNEMKIVEEWKIFENGSLFLEKQQMHLSSQNFCLQPTQVSRDSKDLELSATTCVEKSVAKPVDFSRALDATQVPCHFTDTVNVTDDPHFTNGSYLHDGVLIPAHLVGRYDYIVGFDTEIIKVEMHMRGCICKLKTCMNFCCPWGSVYRNGCTKTDENKEWPTAEFNITMPDDSVRSLNIFDNFVIKIYRPCQKMYALVPEVYAYDDYKLLENGSMLRLDDNVMLSYNEFCMMPLLANDNDTVFLIKPANCHTIGEETSMKIVNAYAMLFSIPFMILTIIVYLAVSELRNQHGKSLVCYLIGLIVGYSCLTTVSLHQIDPAELSCKIIGYTAYYFFMVAFFWLSVISFDLWHNFRGTRRFQEKKRFVVYSLYGWGLPVIFLVFTYIAQEHLDIDPIYKPGIGGGEYCWLDMRHWSIMIYFFGPILIIIMANITMFVMTATKIHRVQHEMARIMAKEGSTKNLRNEKDRFGLFLRLFIVMGVTWFMEIASYFFGQHKTLARFFYITDICNAVQGVLIFILFVMKRKVKQLITSRFSSTLKNECQSQYSSKTTTSSVANLSLTCVTPCAEKPLMLNNQRTNNICTTLKQ